MPDLYSIPSHEPERGRAHAGGLQQMVSRFPQHPACGGLGTTVGGLTGALAEVEAYKAKLAGDKTINPASALVKLANFTRKKLDAAFPPLRQAQAQAQEARRVLVRTIESTFDMSAWPFARVMMAQELRTHFSMLPTKRRAEVLVEAMKAKDEETLLALTVAPARLSGVDPNMWGAARDQLVQSRTPGEAAALAAISDALRYTDTLEASLLHSVSALVDFEQAEKLKASTVEGA